MAIDKNSPLASPSGAALALRSQLPKGQPKAVIHINHGMAEHSARYARFADALSKAGYAVYAHDHRGHGHTTAVDASPGRFAAKDGFKCVLDDVHAVNAHFRSQHTDSPVVVFGHSMGSIIAFNYALQHPQSVDGIALWNAGVDDGLMTSIYGLILKTERFFKGSDVTSTMAKKLAFDAWNKKFAPNRTESDWLSNDTAEVDAYIADPHCGFDISIGLWLDLLGGIRFAANDANLANLPKHLPVNLLAGQDDPCTENGQSVANIERRLLSADLEDVTFTLLPNTRHESLNELNREETTRSFIAWLDRRFAQSDGK